KAMRGFRFLTLSPLLLAVNLDEADVSSPEKVLAPVRAAASVHRATGVVPVCAKLEAEIAELSAGEAAAFRAELGLAEPALDRLIRATYGLLGLCSFFTTGEDEVRAWTVPCGTPAATNSKATASGASGARRCTRPRRPHGSAIASLF